MNWLTRTHSKAVVPRKLATVLKELSFVTDPRSDAVINDSLEHSFPSRVKMSSGRRLATQSPLS